MPLSPFTPAGMQGDSRQFLVEMAGLEKKPAPRILDICCGTGAVIAAIIRRYPQSLAVGYDFSRGMLAKVQEKFPDRPLCLVEGDAAVLPFGDGRFDVVTCSHALYELKGPARQAALEEMRRIVRPDGVVLIMEHEVPRHPVVRRLFNLRMLAMGSSDAREFVAAGATPYRRIFSAVTLYHTPSGKSRLFLCRR